MSRSAAATSAFLFGVEHWSQNFLANFVHLGELASGYRAEFNL